MTLWAQMLLKDRLPAPEPGCLEVIWNEPEQLEVYVQDQSEVQFESYLRLCAGMGYTEDVNEFDYAYDGFDRDGWRLSLNYHVPDRELHILLEKPMEMDAFMLPDFALKAGLPMPESKCGYFLQYYSGLFTLYVGDTGQEDCKDYIRACQAAGFTRNVYEGGYRARNADGYELSVMYVGGSVMAISLAAPNVKLST